MKSISEFLTERVLSGTSDSALYYRQGYIRLNYMADDRWKKRDMEKYHITKDLGDPKNRANITKYGRSVSYPILPDELEVIPRKNWKLRNLGDVNMEAMVQEDDDMVYDWATDNFRKKHDYLLLMQCTNAKPYCSSTQAKAWQRFRGYVDFGSLSDGVYPWVYSNLYPCRWFEWDHAQEDHYMHFLGTRHAIQGILKFQKKHKYKKIFVFCQSAYPQDPVTWMLDENIDNCRDWLVVITTPEFREKVKKAYPTLKNGTYIMRMPIMAMSRQAFVDALCKEIKDKDDRKKLNALVDDSSIETSVNFFDPKVAKKAYADGYWPDDPEWLDKYEKKMREENDKG